MGFDVSYHPIDMRFLEERLLPVVLGSAPLRPLLDEAVALERLRHRAKQWALAALKREPKPDGFDADLHVWGRPFLIGARRQPEISATLDRYRAAKSIAEIDALARENLKQPFELPVDESESKVDGLEATVLRDLDQMISAAAAATAKKPKLLTLPDGTTADPVQVLRESFPFIALSFMSRFRPGWMARGHVWPTKLMADAKLDWTKYFEAPRVLFGSLLTAVPGLRTGRLAPTIEENDMVGGFVSNERVPALRQLLLKERDALLKKPRKEKWEADATLALQKLDEALADAEQRRLSFVEATEVYSGPLGFMN